MARDEPGSPGARRATASATSASNCVARSSLEPRPPVGITRDLAESRRLPSRDGRRQGLRHRPRRYSGCYASQHRAGGIAVKRYLVIYEQAEDGGWGAHSPDVEGAFALGRTREEVEQRMAEALSAQLELLREQGRPLPEPRTEAGRIAA